MSCSLSGNSSRVTVKLLNRWMRLTRWNRRPCNGRRSSALSHKTLRRIARSSLTVLQQQISNCRKKHQIISGMNDLPADPVHKVDNLALAHRQEVEPEIGPGCSHWQTVPVLLRVGDHILPRAQGEEDN